MGGIDVDALRAAAETAHDEIVRLCSAHEDWRMSIPANPERDSDLIFDEVVAQIPALLDRLAVAEAAVERVRALGLEWDELVAFQSGVGARPGNESQRQESTRRADALWRAVTGDPTTACDRWTMTTEEQR